jgi:PAS domain S-box-containing protein
MIKPEEQYHILFDFSPLPGWVFDVETLAFIEVNQMAIRHYGYSREEFLAMTIMDICATEDIPKLQENMKRLAPGLKRVGVWTHKKKDGTFIDVEIFVYDITFRGRPARLVLVNDVTEHQQREEALKKPLGLPPSRKPQAYLLTRSRIRSMGSRPCSRCYCEEKSAATQNPMRCCKTR